MASDVDRQYTNNYLVNSNIEVRRPSLDIQGCYDQDLTDKLRIMFRRSEHISSEFMGIILMVKESRSIVIYLFLQCTIFQRLLS
jgi:hypothetical protein